MGAWGYTNFENDDAADFAAEFREMPTENLLLEAFILVIEAGENEEYIELPEAGAALAAAEIVAAALAKPAADFPEDLQLSVIRLNSEAGVDRRKMARKAVKQILKESELQELWADSSELNQWQAVQQDLLARLK